MIVKGYEAENKTLFVTPAATYQQNSQLPKYIHCLWKKIFLFLSNGSKECHDNHIFFLIVNIQTEIYME
jgi:hypothetical protein